MKKFIFLMFLLCAGVSFCAAQAETGTGEGAGKAAGSVAVELSSDSKTVTVTITNGPGLLSSLLAEDKNTIKNNCWSGTLVVEGRVNNDDITKLNSILSECSFYYKVDLSRAVPVLENKTVAFGSKIYEVVDKMSSCVRRIVLPKGCSIPRKGIVDDGVTNPYNGNTFNESCSFNQDHNLKYLIAPNVEGSKDSYVYVYDRRDNNLTSIPEAEGGGVFYIDGNISTSLQNWIGDDSNPDPNPNVNKYTPGVIVARGTVVVEELISGSLEKTLTSDNSKILTYAGISNVSEITSLTVKNCNIKQEDLKYIGANLTGLQKLNLRKATFGGDSLKYFDALKNLTNLKGIYFPDSQKRFPALFRANRLNLDYAIGYTTVYLYSKREASGAGTPLDLSGVFPYAGEEGYEVVVRGYITEDDIEEIDNAFYTSKVYNFYNATFVYKTKDNEKLKTFLDGISNKKTELNSILYPKYFTLQDLMADAGHVCNEYIIENGAKENEKSLVALCRNGDRLGRAFKRYENEKIQTITVISGKTNVDQQGNTVGQMIDWDKLFNACKEVKYAKILDLSLIDSLHKEATFTSDQKLWSFKQNTDGTQLGSIIAVKLPKGCPISDSKYREMNSPIPVLMRTHVIKTGDWDVWGRVEEDFHNNEICVCEVFVNKPGYLKDVGGLNTVIRNNKVKMVRVRGTMGRKSEEKNGEDNAGLDAFEDCKIPYLNLAGLTQYPKDFSRLKGDKIEYVALPNNCGVTDFYALKNGCPNLKSVGLFEDIDPATAADATGTNEENIRFRYLSFVPGSAMNVLAMLEDPGMETPHAIDGSTPSETNGANIVTRNYVIKEIRMRGRLNMKDISISSKMDNDGHYYPDALGENKSSGAFCMMNVTTNRVNSDGGKYDEDTPLLGNVNSKLSVSKLDFSDAFFGDVVKDEHGNDQYVEHSEDIRVTGIGVGHFDQTKGVEILLPVAKYQTTIPEEAFNVSSIGKLRKVCIPGNFKRIEQKAFYQCNKLTHITTTGTDNLGNGDYENLLIDNGDNTITLPANLEFIGKDAFSLVENIKDVYVLAEKAPVCEVNAFSPGTLYGWGGYNSASPITRDSYVRSEDKTFGILHWPAGIPIEEVKKYTDITREYSILDELQNTDGDGNTLVWPNQTEYNRAYAQATNGYLWNAWDVTKYNDATIKQPAANQLYTDNTQNPDKASCVFYTGTGVEYDNTLYNADYRGWHQFVLTGSVNFKEPETRVWDFSAYKNNDWYSICLPFDMDEDEVLDIFGAKGGTDGAVITDIDGNQTRLNPGETLMPIISTLYKVTRDVDAQRITLWFTHNIADKKQDWDINESKYVDCETNDKGKKILIKAGFPYLIKPYMPYEEIDKVAKYAKRVFPRPKDANQDRYRDFRTIEVGRRGAPASSPTEQLSVKIPYDEWVIKALDKDGNVYDPTDKNYCEYLFIGTYGKGGEIPMYAHFIANNGKKNVWYQNVWEDYHDTWNANTCMILANTTDLGYDAQYANDGTRASSCLVTFKNADDPLYTDDGIAMGAKLGMAFDESIQDGGAVTPIDGIDADGKVLFAPVGKVYDVSGRLVRSEGGVKGLPKGLYIINGKKYVVK